TVTSIRGGGGAACVLMHPVKVTSVGTIRQRICHLVPATVSAILIFVIARNSREVARDMVSDRGNRDAEAALVKVQGKSPFSAALAVESVSADAHFARSQATTKRAGI